LTFDDTIAPVTKFQSIRTIPTFAAKNDLELHQIDVKTGFLYGSLQGTVFMEQPEGFEQGKDLVWKLDRSLYGLKQAPRAWYREFDSTPKAFGFTRKVSDHSIYVRGACSDLIVVGVYVDDLTFASARTSTLEDF
jgi:hypothetical protein